MPKNKSSSDIRFSVVIPAYNEEQNLPACLDALTNQSYSAYEIIVVDNNSTDDTLMIASSYGKVKVIKERRQGIAYARNAGFNVAKGNYIARIDADSIVPKDWLEKMAQVYKADPLAIGVGGPANFYDVPCGKFAGRCHAVYAAYGTKLICNNLLLWGSNMSFKRDIWQKVKHTVNNNNNVWEDVDLSVRAGHYGPIKFLFDNPVLTSARSVDGGIKKQYDYYKHWPATCRQFGLRQYLVSYFLFASIVVVTIIPGTLAIWLAKQNFRKRFQARLSQVRI